MGLAAGAADDDGAEETGGAAGQTGHSGAVEQAESNNTAIAGVQKRIARLGIACII